MVYLSFQLKDIGFGREFGKEDTLTIETRDLQVCKANYSWEEERLTLLDKVGSFGRIDTLVSDVKGIKVAYDSDLLFILLGSKLDPNFTFLASVNKEPEWLCVKPNYYGEERGDETWLDFAHYGIDFNLIKHPLSDDTSREVRELKALMNNYVNREKAETTADCALLKPTTCSAGEWIQKSAEWTVVRNRRKKRLERICQLVESEQLYKVYKKKLNDRQLIQLSTSVQQLGIELQSEKVKNVNLQREINRLQNELTMEREEAIKALQKSQEWRERQLEEITKQKDQKITELETEKAKAKNANLQQEYSFYKNFFDSYFQNKKNELTGLKSGLNKQELEWLDTYYEANQETEKSSFVQKQLKRARDNLQEKFGEEDLELILNKQAEINELEEQLKNLQIQESTQEQSSLQTQIQIPPKRE